MTTRSRDTDGFKGFRKLAIASELTAFAPFLTEAANLSRTVCNLYNSVRSTCLHQRQVWNPLTIAEERNHTRSFLMDLVHGRGVCFENVKSSGPGRFHRSISLAVRWPRAFMETSSPRERSIIVRIRARRSIGAEQRQSHGLACPLLDGARALEVVEVSRGEAGTRGVDLDSGRFEVGSKGDGDRIKRRLGP